MTAVARNDLTYSLSFRWRVLGRFTYKITQDADPRLGRRYVDKCLLPIDPSLLYVSWCKRRLARRARCLSRHGGGLRRRRRCSRGWLSARRRGRAAGRGSAVAALRGARAPPLGGARAAARGRARAAAAAIVIVAALIDLSETSARGSRTTKEATGAYLVLEADIKVETQATALAIVVLIPASQ